MKENGKLIIKGAREHNLKDISVELPRDNLIVITGISGSGKSSLAINTIFAEGQRRYVESLSAYARQFLSLMEKPDVDFIEGLSPAIAIEQRVPSHNPRSTVGTMTEINDYLRLLYARIGTAYCYSCGKKITQQTIAQIVDQILEYPAGKRIQILAPRVRGRKGEYRELFEEIARDGFVRVRVDGEMLSIDKRIELDKNKKHSIEIIVDRLIIKEGVRARLAESVETALAISDGLVIINDADTGDDKIFSEKFACPDCGVSYAELTPRMFSFNSPFGACPKCDGLGWETKINPDLVVSDPSQSILDGAIEPWGEPTGKWLYFQLKGLAQHYDFSLTTPFEDLGENIQDIVLYGTGREKFLVKYKKDYATEESHYYTSFEGVINRLERRYKETDSGRIRHKIERYFSKAPCPECGGTRLRIESRNIKVADRAIFEINEMSIEDAATFFHDLNDSLSKQKQFIARRILKEIRQRLNFLQNVGLGYVTLDRATKTLSGGEAQRINLATQIGSRLTGVLYILDEPSIGLHQRDNIKLLNTLEDLRDLGNTLVVIEHDKETISRADWILELGPHAGTQGGEVVATGPPQQLMSQNNSLTGKLLNNEIDIEYSSERRKGSGKFLDLTGARGNNLKNMDVSFPLGKFICITGVSGSGKSTLITETLYPILARHLHNAKATPLPYKKVTGFEYIDKVVEIDQSPIGRTPRSNPATYTSVFTPIRDLFASLPEAKVRGYDKGRFSFNVKGGRCEACGGTGFVKIEMHFLPDLYVPCDECRTKRYNRETLTIKYKGKNISDVLDMTVDDGLEFFENVPKIQKKLTVLKEVGLGYITLGQPATTLSGGEAQRVKLALELSRRATGNTLYILDEPTVGLHLVDIKMLLKVLNMFVDQGNTVMIIEHNLDVVKVADHIIDLGPEGGDRGGKIIAAGTPEKIVENSRSHTGKYLKEIL